MSGIIKRTIFYYIFNNTVRFLDWAVVETGLGQMVEPFQVNMRRSINVDQQDYDPEDMIARVDGMERISHGHNRLILGHGDPSLHGGVLIPRAGQ